MQVLGHLSDTDGHAARRRKIARHLVRQAPVEAHVVAPCPEFVPGQRVEGVHEIVLPGFAQAPGVLPDGLPIDERGSRVPGVPAAGLPGHRSRVLRALVGHRRPGAVMLEGVPLVRPLQALDECGPALDLLRETLRATLRYCGFNGIPIEVYVMEQAAVIERPLEEDLDLLFVYVGETARDGPFERCRYLRRSEPTVRFVGHVGGPPPEPRPPARRILATSGEGVDAFRSIVPVGEAHLALAARQAGWTLNVVTGGRLPEQGSAQVVRRFRGSPSIRAGRCVEGLSERVNEHRLVSPWAATTPAPSSPRRRRTPSSCRVWPPGSRSSWSRPRGLAAPARSRRGSPGAGPAAGRRSPRPPPAGRPSARRRTCVAGSPRGPG